jgi:hypothetical protein
MKLEFFDRFLKKAQISDLMKIGPVGAKFFQLDGRVKASSHVSQFCKHA